METKTGSRRYDLDWLRVFAILCVFLFHSMRAFNLDPWSVKNPITYPGPQVFTNILDIWMMPLIFVISGASIYFALGKGRLAVVVGKFLKDKVLRLLVPLVVGVFTYTVYIVYLDRLTNGKFSGSFLAFLPHYFDGLYLGSTGDGNFAFHGLHLWYLEVLFVFCVIFLPLFLFLKSRIGARLLSGLTKIMAVPGVFYVLLVLPVTLCENLLPPDSLLRIRFFSWGLAPYMCFFLSGFVIISSEPLQRSIMRLRWLSLAIGIASTALWFVTDAHSDLMVWGWILTILGFGMKHLNVNSPALQYASEAVLPFYIEHQTVIIIIGFSVVTWAIPDPLKWAIITISSFAIIMGLYEGLIRRINVLRVLFGMKSLKKAAQAVPLPSQPVEVGS
jgi:glucan biosynthesis protein C